MRLAEWAEPLWARMGDALDWFPTEPITVIILDESDDLQAWAWPTRGTVVLSAQPGLELARSRSRGDQLVDVFAHELAHVFTHKRSTSHSELTSFGSEHWTHLETDGLAVGARLPVTGALPQWWSEGGAEFLATATGHGWWASGRAASVRLAVAEDRLLTWAELQVAIDKGDVGDGELAYQQGHAFFRWLEAEYGRGTFARIHAAASERTRIEPTAVLRKVTGVSARELHGRFVADLEREIDARIRRRTEQGRVEGAELWRWDQEWRSTELSTLDAWEGRTRRDRESERSATGSWNLHPQWSADGRWLGEHRAGWVRVRQSSEAQWPALQERDVAYGADSRLYDAGRSLELWIPARFGSDWSFVPGQDAVVVSAPAPMQGADFDGSSLHRLYRVDLTPRTTRSRRSPERLDRLASRVEPIPGTERAVDPAVSPDGTRIAFARRHAGIPQLAIARDGQVRTLLELPAPSSIGSPTWSPAGDRIAVSVHHGHRTDLWAIAVEDGAITRLTDDRWDASDPAWTPEGILFSADVDGFRDIFRLDPDSGAVERLTRSHGDAVTPSLSPSGHLLYAQRTGHGWKSMALRREAFAAADSDAFHTLPEGPPVEVREPYERAIEPYRPLRSALPLAVAPELRVLAEPAGFSPLAGGWLLARDPAEHLALSLYGMAGSDALISGAFTTRIAAPEIGVWAGWEDDARWLESGERQRVVAGGAGLNLSWELAPDALALLAEATALKIGFRQASAPIPLSRTQKGSLGFQLGDPGPLGRLTGQGGTLEIVGTRGLSSPASETAAVGWWRVRMIAAGAVRSGPFRFDARSVSGWTDRDVPPFDELKAGGDAPSALRLSTFEGAIVFPGFGPRSISGENLALLSAGVLLPIRDVRRRVGPVYLDDLGFRLGGDVGRAWSVLSGDEPVLADAVGELRVAGEAADQTWNSVVRVARGFGEPAPTGDPTDLRRPAGPWRVVVGLGTGW